MCSKHRAQRLNEDYNSDMKILYRIIDGSCRKYHLCRDKGFVATDTCLSQQRVCRDKARLLSRQKYACREKTLFVATSILLSQQKTCFCCDKIIFVATNVVSVVKNVLSQQAYVFVAFVAAAANDNSEHT